MRPRVLDHASDYRARLPADRVRGRAEPPSEVEQLFEGRSTGADGSPPVRLIFDDGTVGTFVEGSEEEARARYLAGHLLSLR